MCFCVFAIGDNILAVLRHLVMSKKSLLPNPSIYKHGATTFLDLLGLYMLTIPFRLVVTLNWICSAGGFLFIIRRIVFAKGRKSFIILMIVDIALLTVK